MLARRSDPFASFGDLRTEIDRVFERFFEDKPASGLGFDARGVWVPALDVTEKGESIVVRAEVPGVDPSKVEISIQDDVLTLKGEKEEAREEKGKDIYRSERRFGAFVRRVPLPALVDDSSVHAACKDGVLTIEMKRSKAALPRRIPVQVATP